MFSDPWRCKECRLEIGLGLSHGRGYDARLFACRSCGTSHAIENSIENQNRLLHLPEPYFADPDDGKLKADTNGNTYITFMWMPFNWPHVEGEFFEKDIENMACTYCSAVELTTEWTQHDQCPSCGGDMQRKHDLYNQTQGNDG